MLISSTQKDIKRRRQMNVIIFISFLLVGLSKGIFMAFATAANAVILFGFFITIDIFVVRYGVLLYAFCHWFLLTAFIILTFRKGYGVNDFGFEMVVDGDVKLAGMLYYSTIALIDTAINISIYYLVYAAVLATKYAVCRFGHWRSSQCVG